MCLIRSLECEQRPGHDSLVNDPSIDENNRTEVNKNRIEIPRVDDRISNEVRALLNWRLVDHIWDICSRFSCTNDDLTAIRSKKWHRNDGTRRISEDLNIHKSSIPLF